MESNEKEPTTENEISTQEELGSIPEPQNPKEAKAEQELSPGGELEITPEEATPQIKEPSPPGEYSTPDDPKYQELLKELRKLKGRNALSEKGVKGELLDDLSELYSETGGNVDEFLVTRQWSLNPPPQTASPNPPGGKSITMEDLSHMSVEEINANWDTISKKLSVGTRGNIRVKSKR